MNIDLNYMFKQWGVLIKYNSYRPYNFSDVVFLSKEEKDNIEKGFVPASDYN
jgi:hypothetical protein